MEAVLNGAPDIMPRDAPAVVTGAGGFVGRVVARKLARLGHVVRGGTRDGRDLGDGIQPCILDVTARESLTAALMGADSVVHCAYGGRAATVDGTANLLRAAAACGVRRVVHLSSIAVYGQASGMVREDSPTLAPAGSGYAHWKAAAEAACRAAKGVETVMLRPGIVYGADSEQWIKLPARRLRHESWGDLGEAGSGTANLVHVEDLAAACVAALHARGIAGEAFNIVGADTPSWRDYYRRIAVVLRRAELPPISLGAWRRRMYVGLSARLLVRAVPPLAHRLRESILLTPSPSELRLFGLAATYTGTKAEQRLGFEAAIGLDAGLADALGMVEA
jgi:nucleoside-diphosphate-sugar epimerase